jgi:hypothetical protein
MAVRKTFPSSGLSLVWEHAREGYIRVQFKQVRSMLRTELGLNPLHGEVQSETDEAPKLSDVWDSGGRA